MGITQIFHRKSNTSGQSTSQEIVNLFGNLGDTNQYHNWQKKKAETTEGGCTGSWSTAEGSGNWHCLVKLNIHIPYEPAVPFLGI